MANMDADGPSTIEATATPVACPVVPPGSGRLNIMTMNENAAKTESRGTSLVCRARFMRRSATYQKGAAATYSPAQVPGLRYPSGICILSGAARRFPALFRILFATPSKGYEAVPPLDAAMFPAALAEACHSSQGSVYRKRKRRHRHGIGTARIKTNLFETEYG